MSWFMIFIITKWFEYHTISQEKVQNQCFKFHLCIYFFFVSISNHVLPQPPPIKFTNKKTTHFLSTSTHTTSLLPQSWYQVISPEKKKKKKRKVVSKLFFPKKADPLPPSQNNEIRHHIPHTLFFVCPARGWQVSKPQPLEWKSGRKKNENWQNLTKNPERKDRWKKIDEKSKRNQKKGMRVCRRRSWSWSWRWRWRWNRKKENTKN